LGKPKPEKPWTISRRARRWRLAPFARAAPSTKRSWCASIAAAERLRLIARRSPSASPGEKPAKAMATSMTWSWKMIVPSVSRSTGSSEGWS
jgi:hypothetical protein